MNHVPVSLIYKDDDYFLNPFCFKHFITFLSCLARSSGVVFGVVSNSLHLLSTYSHRAISFSSCFGVIPPLSKASLIESF